MAFSFNIVITEKWTQNRSHLLYKQRINYEKFLDVPPVPYKKTVSFVNFKHSTMATYPSVICKIHVRLRQQALECDGCFQWQHCLCNSGNFNFFLWAATYQISKTNIQKSPRTSYNTPGPFTRKRLSARLSFCLKLATSLRHQYLVLQHSLTLTNLI